MDCTDFLKKGDIIVTSDGLLCVYDQKAFDGSYYSQVCNNIDDNIVLDMKHRILDYRFATIDEKKRLKRLCAKNGIDLVSKRKKRNIIYYND